MVDVAAIDNEMRAALMEYPREDVPDLTFTAMVGPDPLRRTHSIEHAADANGISVRYRYLDSQGGLCAERREDIVLLLSDELLRLMSEQGYEVLHTFGWYDGRRYCDTDRKLIVVARTKE